MDRFDRDVYVAETCRLEHRIAWSVLAVGECTNAPPSLLTTLRPPFGASCLINACIAFEFTSQRDEREGRSAEACALDPKVGAGAW